MTPSLLFFLNATVSKLLLLGKDSELLLHDCSSVFGNRSDCRVSLGTSNKTDQALELLAVSIQENRQGHFYQVEVVLPPLIREDLIEYLGKCHIELRCIEHLGSIASVKGFGVTSGCYDVLLVDPEPKAVARWTATAGLLLVLFGEALEIDIAGTFIIELLHFLFCRSDYPLDEVVGARVFNLLYEFAINLARFLFVQSEPLTDIINLQEELFLLLPAPLTNELVEPLGVLAFELSGNVGIVRSITAVFLGLHKVGNEAVVKIHTEGLASG